MNYLAFAAAILIVVLVTMRLVVSILHAVQRLRASMDAEQLSQALLEQKITSARRVSEQAAAGWKGYRKFAVHRRELEADGVCSFYLTPHDRKPLPSYRPGQYLTLQLNVPGTEKPVVRCYSLSDVYRPDQYRITIKQATAPADGTQLPDGLVSSYFHQRVEVGDLLDVQAPSGNFFLDPEDHRPAVLIAGGIGVTPILSMAKTIVETDTNREFTIFYGIHDESVHAFEQELQELAQFPNCRLITCFSVANGDVTGESKHAGRLSLELLKDALRTPNYEFFICGPPAMMQTLPRQLLDWGVSKANLRTEAFGPASVKQVVASKDAAERASELPGKCQITFARSGVQANWDLQAGNLLEFALEQGIDVVSGCRAGNCGTCSVAIKSGTVDYQSHPGVQPEEGTCLMCVAQPAENLVLDA